MPTLLCSIYTGAGVFFASWCNAQVRQYSSNRDMHADKLGLGANTSATCCTLVLEQLTPHPWSESIVRNWHVLSL